jgi:hypothetical protein
MGRGWGREGQFMSNLGPRWTGSHHTKGGIPSKYEGVGKGNQQGGAPSLDVANLCIYISYQCTNEANKRICLGYK